MVEIKAENLKIGYGRDVVAKGINFEVDSGDYFCIVGENGAGKSTLMKTILKLQEPQGGKILYENGIKPNEIGYLPQSTQVQKDFPASVFEVVLSGRQSSLGFKPFFSKADKENALANMSRLDITDLKNRCYRDLSGGQKQRVLLARALCAAKKMLLLDEPVSGLDPKVTLEMYKIIKKLNDEGITIIMISHDVISSMTYADKILYLGSEQSCNFFGTCDEFKKSKTGRKYLSEGENKI